MINSIILDDLLSSCSTSSGFDTKILNFLSHSSAPLILALPAHVKQSFTRKLGLDAGIPNEDYKVGAEID